MEVKSMSKRILIVDDERSLVFLLGENLRTMGSEYQVQTAHCGEDALDKATREPFDLIVTDHRMPGMSGLELIRRLRHVNPSIRTILITAYGDDIIEAEACQLGVFRYIRKPFQADEFLRATEEALVE
jgi:CheY-like chemotaxis protein